MAIEYTEMDEKALLDVADILSKREAIDAELEQVQNNRAAAEVKWAEKEQALKAEKNALIFAVRNMRKASIVDEKVINPVFTSKV